MRDLTLEEFGLIGEFSEEYSEYLWEHKEEATLETMQKVILDAVDHLLLIKGKQMLDSMVGIEK